MVITEIIKPIRIVILLGAPFTAQNFERVGIPYLSKHFEVMVFDCTEWMGRNAKGINCQRSYWSNYVVINSEMDLAVEIEKYRPDYAIDFIGFGNFTLSICQILAKNNVTFIVQKTGSLPTVGISVRIKNILMALIFKRNTLDILVDSKNSTVVSSKAIRVKLVVKLFDKIKCKLQQILIIKKINSLPNYIGLIAGYKALDRFTSKSKPIIWIGSNDYHTFHKAKKELALNRYHQINEPFILFIDDALASASDWTLLGIPPPVTGSLYYPDLNAFFESIETTYSMPVKIAGHPNSVTDENYQSKMGGRSVIFGSTAELTLQSTIVLVHASTATSFAVLARKPIISLTTQELDRGHYGLHVRTMSQSLGTPLVFIDRYSKQINDLRTLVVDELKYNLYEANYLCNDLSNEKEPWEALIEFINNSSKVDCCS